jgi:hypothetical protein
MSEQPVGSTDPAKSGYYKQLNTQPRKNKRLSDYKLVVLLAGKQVLSARK